MSWVSCVHTWFRYVQQRPPSLRGRSGLWRRRRHPRRALSACSGGSVRPGGAEAPPEMEGSSADSASPAARSPPPPGRWGPLAPSERSSTRDCYTGWSAQRTHWGDRRGVRPPVTHQHTSDINNTKISEEHFIFKLNSLIISLVLGFSFPADDQ